MLEVNAEKIIGLIVVGVIVWAIVPITGYIQEKVFHQKIEVKK